MKNNVLDLKSRRRRRGRFQNRQKERAGEEKAERVAEETRDREKHRQTKLWIQEREDIAAAFEAAREERLRDFYSRLDPEARNPRHGEPSLSSAEGAGLPWLRSQGFLGAEFCGSKRAIHSATAPQTSNTP